MTADDDPIDVRTLTRQLRANPYGGEKTNVSLRATLGSTPAELYATLVNKLGIRPLPGTAASLLDGAVQGYVMEVLDGRHIVLALSLTDERWPEGHYSTTTFMLRAEADGTTMVIFQQDVPESLVGDVREMWQRGYVDPLLR